MSLTFCKGMLHETDRDSIWGTGDMGTLRAIGCCLSGMIVLASAQPAFSAVSVRIGGTYLDSNRAMIDAFGLTSLNPLFSAGVLLDFDVGGRGVEHRAGAGSFIHRRDGRIVDIEPHWGWRTKSWTAAMTGLDLFGREDDHEDNSDFSYILKGNSALILFAAGRPPGSIDFDISVYAQETLTEGFTPYASQRRMPIDPKLIDDYIPGQPDSAQFGSIKCNHYPGAAVLTSTTDRAFVTHTYSNASKSNCAVTIDTARFVPVMPPAAPVPEPATWLMMIAGFGAVGSSLRGRSQPIRKW